MILWYLPIALAAPQFNEGTWKGKLSLTQGIRTIKIFIQREKELLKTKSPQNKRSSTKCCNQ